MTHPSTYEEIHKYLTSLLASTEPIKIEKNGQTYIQIKGFRRAFHIHSIWHKVSNDSFVFYVSPDDDATFADFPTRSSPTYDGLIDEVTKMYVRLWSTAP